MKLPSTAIFWEGVKGKQQPFGLQLCTHGCTFAWHFCCGLIDGENAPQSLFVMSDSETYVTDLTRILRLKQTKFSLIGMYFFLHKHGSDILLNLKVMLTVKCYAQDFHLGRFSTFFCTQKLPFWAL